jgi:cyclic dehypoxanthinyl futalosine synthase
MNTLSDIIEKIQHRDRIDINDARVLLKEADLLTLGTLANARRFDHHPQTVVTYVVDRNINYTNICVSGCRFCAFFKAPGQEGGYVITRQALADKIKETIDLGGTQILLQGECIRTWAWIFTKTC